MRLLPLPGGQRARQVVPVASMLLALGLAAALAFQAVQAERSYRRVAEATLQDYADFAAYILGSRVFGNVQGQVGSDLDAVRSVAIGDRGPESLDALLGPCTASAEAGPRWAFHLDVATGSFQAWGTPPDGVTAWARDTVQADAGRDEVRRFPFSHVFGGPGDQRVALVYAAQRDAWEQPVRIYGLTPCFQRGDRSVFELSLRGPSAVPPTLTASVPNDSLLSVRVTDPTGATVWASPGQYPDRFTGTDRVWGPFGGLALNVSLSPDVAGLLVAGGMPRSRLPVTLGLLALAAVLVLAALFQLRREQDLVRLREGFVGSVSHELRTPLQQVLLFVELLRMKKLRTRDEETRSLEIVEEETRRLIQLVENLLQFSKAGRRDLRVEPRPVDLEPVVRETLESFQPLARAGRAHVSAQLEPAVAQADPEAVRRVLLNLLDNAVKYGPPEQTVTVRLASKNGDAVLEVEDQGPGVPPEERPRIFEPFYRGRGAGAETGSGIGLSIVGDLVERQHGRVRVSEAPGGGARFTVSMPAPSDPEPGP